jgi:hypothetical protein
MSTDGAPPDGAPTPTDPPTAPLSPGPAGSTDPAPAPSAQPLAPELAWSTDSPWSVGAVPPPVPQPVPTAGWSGAAGPPHLGAPGQVAAAGPPGAPPRPVPPPPREAWARPRKVEAVPGTSFALVHLDVPPVTSGLAVGALVAGIVSILVSFVVGCFGLAGAQDGWGVWVGGAFALVAAVTGGAGVVLGWLGMRQIRQVAPPPAIRFTGRGVAISGIACGATGLGLTVLGLAMAALIQAAS